MCHGENNGKHNDITLGSQDIDGAYVTRYVEGKGEKRAQEL